MKNIFTGHERRRGERGQAVLETALVMPLYMLVLFGLLFFGYKTLNRQRQGLATAYASWTYTGAVPDTEQLKEEFIPWASEGDGAFLYVRTHESGFLNADPYYGGQVERQLTSGVAGETEDTFHSERVQVDLWTTALGKITQRFDWNEGAGTIATSDITDNQMSRYLRRDPEQNSLPGRFIDIDFSATDPVNEQYPLLATRALNGPYVGAPVTERWLRRLRLSTEARFVPPYSSMVQKNLSHPKDPTFSEYITLSFGESPAEHSDIVQFDVTARGGAARSGGFDGTASQERQDAFLAEMHQFLTGAYAEAGYRALDTPDAMKDSIEGIVIGSGGANFGDKIWTKY